MQAYNISAVTFYSHTHRKEDQVRFINLDLLIAAGRK